MSGDARLMNLILAPVISEKSTDMADRLRTTVFFVAPDARKDEIKRAVEKMFEVKVESVRVANSRTRVEKGMRYPKRRPFARKAFVRLAKGEDINFAELQ